MNPPCDPADESQPHWRSIVEAQSELVSLASADGLLVYVNAAYARHFGQRAQDMVGTNLFDHIAPHDREGVRTRLGQVLQDGVARFSENRMTAADGSLCWVAWTNSVQRRAGQPQLLLSVGRDVTERRRLEQEAAANERFLRQLADNLPLRIGYLDRERRYRFVNDAMLRRFDRSRAEVIGRTRAELLPGDEEPALAAGASAALDGRAQRFEFDEIVDGQRRRFENRLVPDRDESGQVRGFFVTGIDITERQAAEQARRDLAAIIDNTTDFVVQTDEEGRLIYVNDAGRRVLGLDADAPLPQRRLAEFQDAATQHLYADMVLPALQRGQVWVGQSTLRLADGNALPVSHMVIAHRDAGGRIERYSAVMRDISGAMQAQHELQRQTATLRSVADAIPATVAVVDRAGHYRFVNRAFERASGMAAEQILGRGPRELLGEAEFERRRPWVERALAGEVVQFELAYRGGDGERHLALSYIPLCLEGAPDMDGFVVVTQDVSAHRHEATRLRQLAERDPLTGLLNRAGFEQALDALQFEGAVPPALLYIDLDHFKSVNDCHGHAAGDQVLQQFARRLAGVVRPTDAVARLGGDEFAVALPGLREVAHARTVADKVLAAAARPFQLEGLQVQIGASVGLACGDGGTDWRALVARADAGLLLAKAGGRGRHADAPP